MRQQEPYVPSLVDSGRYPVLSRVILDADTPHDPDRLDTSFRRDPELVPDGITSLLPNAGAPRLGSCRCLRAV
jgi:hypothetical protein